MLSVKGITLFSVFILSINTIFSQNLYNINYINELKIYFYNNDWRGKLNTYKINKSNKRVLAKIILNGAEYDSVGIKFKGNSSFNAYYVKNPFNIKLNYKVKKQQIEGFKTLKFSNIFRDPSGIREVLAYHIIGKYIACPKANFTQVFVNDSLIGLYTNVENIDKSFIKNKFSNNKNVFFKCESNTNELKPKGCNTSVADGLTIGFTLDSNCYTGKYELLSKYGWNELLNMMMTLWYNNDNKSVYYHKIQNLIDVDKIMWMLAFNNLFVNLDSYNWSGRNYYLIQDSSGKFCPILWDMNMAFGGFSHSYPNNLLAEFPVFASEDYIYRPLISKLFKIKEYRELYISHYITLIKNELLSGNFEKEAVKLHNLIKPYIEKDKYFYYKGINFENSLYKIYQYEIPGIIELMTKRLTYLKKVHELQSAFK